MKQPLKSAVESPKRSGAEIRNNFPEGTRLPSGKIVVAGEAIRKQRPPAATVNAAKPKSGAEIEAEKLMAEAKAKKNSPQKK